MRIWRGERSEGGLLISSCMRRMREPISCICFASDRESSPSLLISTDSRRQVPPLYENSTAGRLLPGEHVVGGADAGRAAAAAAEEEDEEEEEEDEEEDEEDDEEAPVLELSIAPDELRAAALTSASIASMRGVRSSTGREGQRKSVESKERKRARHTHEEREESEKEREMGTDRSQVKKWTQALL